MVTAGCDQPQPGSLLELLHRREETFTGVEATYGICRLGERLAAACRNEIESRSVHQSTIQFRSRT
jgi:hypothetical protein